MSNATLTSHRVRRSFLKKRQALTLHHAEGTIISVDSGCLWVTLENDVRDVILARGMRFEIDRPGRTIIAAEADTRFRLVFEETLWTSLAASLGRWLDSAQHRWAGRLSRRVVPYF